MNHAMGRDARRRWRALSFGGGLAFGIACSFAGCATTPVAGECADTVDLRCMTRKVCSPDRTRGCMRCGCEAALQPQVPTSTESLRPEARP